MRVSRASGRLWLGLLLIGLIATLVVELAVRSVVDLRLYGRDDYLGYWNLPGQRGNAMLTGSFAVNQQGILTERAFSNSTSTFDVLLAGDSLVQGINGLDQTQRLAARLENISGWRVWPVAAGSWSLSNEVRYLKRSNLHTNVDAIIFLVNEGDLELPSAWDSEYTHPTKSPQFYTWYILRKKISETSHTQSPRSERLPGNLIDEWRSFRSSAKVPIYFVAYNSRQSKVRGCGWLPDSLGAEKVVCVDTWSDFTLGEMHDDIHPNAQGNDTLAKLIWTRLARQLAKSGPAA